MRDMSSCSRVRTEPGEDPSLDPEALGGARHALTLLLHPVRGYRCRQAAFEESLAGG